MKDWLRELFYVKVQNGKTYWIESATKAFLTLLRITVLTLVALIIAAYGLQIVVAFLNVGGSEIAEPFTSEMLITFAGLKAVAALLLGYLQKNYSEHKKTTVESFLNSVSHVESNPDSDSQSGESEPEPGADAIEDKSK